MLLFIEIHMFSYMAQKTLHGKKRNIQRSLVFIFIDLFMLYLSRNVFSVKHIQAWFFLTKMSHPCQNTFVGEKYRLCFFKLPYTYSRCEMSITIDLPCLLQDKGVEVLL